MTPIGTLWGEPRLPLTKIILSIAALNELELTQPEWGFINKPTEFTTKFPYGKVPAFEGADGFKLIECATISRYLCGLGTKVDLMGRDARERILVDQWTHFAEQEIGAPTHQLMVMLYDPTAAPFNRKALDRQVEQVVKALEYVEAHLGTRPSGYLVTDAVTIADLFLAGMAYGTAFAALGAQERARFPGVFAHCARVTGDERVKQFWGTERFVEVAVTEPRSFT